MGIRSYQKTIVLRLGVGIFMAVAVAGAVSCGRLFIEPSVPAEAPAAAASGSSSSGAAATVYNYYVYISNNGNLRILEYSQSQTTGALTYLAQNNTGTPQPKTLTAHPNGKFLYAASDAGDKIFVYSINQTTGLLTKIQDIATEDLPAYSTINPAGTCFFASNSTTGSVSAYSIGGDGLLTLAEHEAGFNTPRGLGVHRSGNFLHVVNSGTSQVWLHNIASDCTISTAADTIASGAGPYGLTGHPSKDFVYVSNNSAQSISIYTVNPSTGVLSSAGTQASVGSTLYPYVDPSGMYLYTGRYASGALSGGVFGYTINQSTGLLTALGTNAATRLNDYCFTSVADPLSKYLYLYCDDGGGNYYVKYYSIASGTGELTDSGTSYNPSGAGWGLAAIRIAQ